MKVHIVALMGMKLLIEPGRAPRQMRWSVIRALVWNMEDAD